jgi:hypothetical protein
MSELQARGYIVANSITFLRDNVPKDEWKRITTAWSPELQQLVGANVKPADWYPVSQVTEINRSIVSSLGKGEDEPARQALHKCGKFIAAEATNTFLKLFLKLLTPSLLIKKLPDIFKRDFSQGRLTAESKGQVLTCACYDLPGYEHIIVTASGFIATAMENMGKTVDNIKVNNWSLQNPCIDGASFELTWRD